MSDEETPKQPASDEVTCTFPLHPVNGVMWASFIGTPFAAGVVMAINYVRMRRKRAAVITVTVATAATGVLLALAATLPMDTPNTIFLLANLVVMAAVRGIADELQGKVILRYSTLQGTVASAWKSVLIAGLCVPFVLGTVFSLAILLEPPPATVVEFGNDEVYCSGDASKEDARRLALVLQEFGAFGSRQGGSAWMDASSEGYSFSFLLAEDGWEDSKTVAAFMALGRALEDSGFRTPLKIHLCDVHLEARKTLAIR